MQCPENPVEMLLACIRAVSHLFPDAAVHCSYPDQAWRKPAIQNLHAEMRCAILVAIAKTKFGVTECRLLSLLLSPRRIRIK